MGKQSGNKNNKTNKGKSKDKGVKKKIILLAFLLCVLCVMLIGCVVFIVVKLTNKLPESSDFSQIDSSEDSSEYLDIEEYFEANSEIKSVVSAVDSPNNLSEQNAVEVLENLGFIEYQVTTNYSIDGTFVEAVEASGSSADKHPLYETYYITENNELWVISVIDGTIMATPSSYNLEYSENVPIVVSESEEIVSYDSSTNSFYRTIPKDTVLKVWIVDRIDAETLEALTMEELANG